MRRVTAGVVLVVGVGTSLPGTRTTAAAANRQIYLNRLSVVLAPDLSLLRYESAGVRGVK